MSADDGNASGNAPGSPGTDRGTHEAPVVADPLAVRAAVSAATAAPEDVPLVVGPGSSGPGRRAPGEVGAQPVIDGVAQSVRLERRDAARAVLVEGEGLHAWRTRVLFGPVRVGTDGRERREVVVDGWRFEVEVEQEQRARLRDRAGGAGGGGAARGGRAEIRAMIPGKVVAVDVKPGDHVEAGERLLVLEAMKMQNEVHADRAGTVERVEVTAGRTVELGDLLVVVT